MNVPEPLQDADRHGAVVRTLEYDDGTVIAVDFGTAADLTIDVVDSSVIVVTGDGQFEFELPPEATDISGNNGILTIQE
ncbi:hypothetical protein D8Y22_05715 [Salinadaptatus halalkaliphilus]|uniref:Hsp20/alpha crystallin family protein n=1 Tax=Salinadaptatus halalkaliphilus TaxID=2419781 RepID=A0A4S3TN10_9EURY|nr:hypothetical protein [Salinadaptatus halalkaliphilus]THE65674.1 hypothetical protein D8Y22_05715 [Salinadaptatus halalkaliphilus]